MHFSNSITDVIEFVIRSYQTQRNNAYSAHRRSMCTVNFTPLSYSRLEVTAKENPRLTVHFLEVVTFHFVISPRYNSNDLVTVSHCMYAVCFCSLQTCNLCILFGFSVSEKRGAPNTSRLSVDGNKAAILFSSLLLETSLTLYTTTAVDA